MVKKSPSGPNKAGAGKRKPTNSGSKSHKQPAPSASSSSLATRPEDARPEKVPAEDLRAQQALLDVFADVFAGELSAVEDKQEETERGGQATFSRALREVKQALYDRDFAAAFGREDYLRAYAARWSPTRALCYARVLRGLGAHLQGLHSAAGGGRGEGGRDRDGDEGDAGGEASRESGAGDEEQKPQQRLAPELKVLAIGGGAAETVAFGAFLSSSLPSSSSGDPLSPPLRGTLHLVDSGPWGGIISALTARLTTPPPLSKYASAAARAANVALVAPPDRLRTPFTQRDILELSEAELEGLLRHPGPGEDESRGAVMERKEETEGSTPAPAPVLITLLFTLNELYTAAGVGPTTAFLRRLTVAVVPGSLLLVVDSPGSYSEAAVGKGRGAGEAGEAEKKKYPMQWLLDHTLLPREKGKKEQDHQQQQQHEVVEEGKEDKSEETEEGPRDRRKEEADLTTVWEKLESDDSVWFRLAEGLRYPIQLENMRYQMHLYRAIRR